MAQQALYRKWRSRSFDELIGQPHVVRTLQNALESGRVAHAYIFSGPRGTGKTSSARLLAKAVNCLAPADQRPCNDCHLCRSITDGSAMDLIEIDAASNTQVDKVRDVIVEKVNFAPSEARQKIYIIDEVHMLSNSAFNALLKTIEEPPPHAMFILATTEIHKIPATILSRCQRLDFRRIGVEEVVGHLEWVLAQEGISAEPAVLELVARQATGSMRDALSLLDQLLSHGGTHLTVEQARAALGLAATESVQALVDYILAQDVGGALQLVNRLIDQGTDPRQFLTDVLDHLRALLLTLAGGDRQLLNLPDEAVARLRAQKKYIGPPALIELIRLFNQAGADLKLGLQPQLPLELAIIESVLALQARGQEAAPAPSERLADIEPPTEAPKPRAPRAVPPPPVSQARTETEPVAPVRGPRPALFADLNETEPVAPVRGPRPALFADLNETEPVAPMRGPRPALFAEEEPPSEATLPRAPRSVEAPPTPPPLWEEETPPAPPPMLRERPLVIEERVPTDGGDHTLGWWQSQWEAFKSFLVKQGGDAERAALRVKFGEPVAVDAGGLTIGFTYSIHLEKVQGSKERVAVERAVAAFSGSPIAVRFVLAPKAQPVQPAKDKYAEAAEDPVVKEALRHGGRIIDVVSPDQ